MVYLSADVGGTFTDLVLIDTESGRLSIDKVPTTPGSATAISAGITRILAAQGRSISDVNIFVHGFTIATNAFLTRAGARVALITTAGFRDVLEIGTQQRAHLYSLTERKPPPIVPRSQAVEVDERIDSFGSIVKGLTDASVEAAVQATTAVRPDAIAISLLFSHLNPAHEVRIRDALERRFPDKPIYCSSQINPQIEEYARASTTTIAAYVGPEVRRYLESLEGELRRIGLKAPILLMRSDGGVATIPAILENPALTLFSGPAGCVIGGGLTATQERIPNIVTFDMGGTTADFSVIAGGEPRHKGSRIVDGLPLRLPSLDIESISAGGGSIAYVDRGGGLKVGPRSAGAVPGPACYGKGGTDATVTDAAVVLGILDPDDYLGGEMPLFADRAREAIRRSVAEPLGLEIEEAAYGIMAVANAQMCQAIRTLSVERGCDIRDFALLACGGAGPVHAPYMARELEMSEVIVPVFPGVFAAQGLLGTDIRHSAQRPYQIDLDEVNPAELADCLHRLRAELDDALARDQIPPEDRQFRYHADLRCIGQFHELSAPLPSPDDRAWWRPELIAEAFYDLHLKSFGHADRAVPVEIVNVRVEAFGRTPKPSANAGSTSNPGPVRAAKTRPVYIDRKTGFVDCPVYRRGDLRPGHRLEGPGIVVQRDSTTVILPQQIATVAESGMIRISVNARQA